MPAPDTPRPAQPLSAGPTPDNESRSADRRMAGVYVRTLLWYLLGVAILWLVGFEGIYGHPTPFYALYAPVFSSVVVPGVMAILMALAYWAASRRYVRRSRTRQAAGFALVVLPIALLIGVLYQEAVHRHQAWSGLVLEYGRLLGWHMPALALFLVFMAALQYALGRLDWFNTPLSPRGLRRAVAALVLFGALFACAIAMIRNGPNGISQAYQRETYEYIGDIGKTPSIRALFERYLEIRPYLSMHAKVHPPGPIALLWLLSYIVGRGAMALALATVAGGALAVLPLYLWARELTNQRIALTCCLLYALIPSIVLFTATSTDILFTPVTLTTLWLFERAIRRPSIPCALAAGAGYGIMGLLKFSLFGVGIYFGLAGLWMLSKRETRRHVIQTAVIMGGAALAVHAGVWLWSGYNTLEVFRAAKAQFDVDQFHLDALTPRYPGWMWHILNPACWFFFAGIPVSVLFLKRLFRPEPGTKALFLIFLLTLGVLDLLYLARGEGERSALYIFPFLALPAAHVLDEMGRKAKSMTPLLATLAFLGFQCWFIESYFYTYW